MTYFTRILSISVLLLVGTPEVSAQKFFKFNRFVDSVLTKKYWSADIDTNYITRPNTKWTLVGRINVSGAKLKTDGVEDGRHFNSEMKADYKSTVSVGVSYLGLSLNLSLNPGKLAGKYRDYELNFRSYGRRFGFDVAYQDARNFTGWHEFEGQERMDLPADVLSLKTLNANAYYAFNPRRFSYPAAFAHSYIQRRSAGSFLLAVSGQGQKARVNGTMLSVLSVTNIGLGAGYGYNYVPANGWLLHLSALPTFIVYSNTSLKVDNNRIPLNYHFPEVIITGRGAVVKQIGRNKFVGISMVFNFTNIGSEDRLSVSNTKWCTRLSFGFRL